MTDFSNSATVQLIGLGTRFRRWCETCVAALIADLAGRADGSGRGPVLLVESGTTTLFGPAKSGERAVVARLENVGGVPPSEAMRQMAGHPKGELILRLGSGKAVIARISLPAAAADVLAAVIRNKVESLAPWPVSEALWGYRILDGAAGGQILVDVGVVSRHNLEAVVTALQGAGLRASQLEIAAASGDVAIPVDFLAENRMRRARRAVALTFAAFAAVAVAIATYGLYQAVTKSEELAGIESRIDTLRQALQGKRAGAGNAKLEAANKLFERKRDGRPFVMLLNDLTRLVPDGTWLTALNFDGSRITITGHGSEVPKLVETLEKSDSFADVGFAAATQRDPDGKGETFSISTGVRARVVP
jgi:Tfp pilus assembly protein PilN